MRPERTNCFQLIEPHLRTKLKNIYRNRKIASTKQVKEKYLTYNQNLLGKQNKTKQNIKQENIAHNEEKKWDGGNGSVMFKVVILYMN